MELTFSVLGLVLTAEVDVDGKYHAATYWEPAEFPDMNFVSLTCEGQNASWLFNSETLTEMIEDAAWSALEQHDKQMSMEMWT